MQNSLNRQPETQPIDADQRAEAQFAQKDGISLELSHSEKAVLNTLANETGYADYKSFLSARLAGAYQYQLGIIERGEAVLQQIPELEPDLPQTRDALSTLLREGKGNIKTPLNVVFGDVPIDRWSGRNLIEAMLTESGYSPYHARIEIFDAREPKMLIVRAEQQTQEESRVYELLRRSREIDQHVLFPEGSEAPFLQQKGNTCYRHSAFCALANHPHGPNMLGSMIQQVKNDVYTVMFPGVSQGPIEVMSDSARSHVLQEQGREPVSFVSGSLGTSLISHAYSKVEALLNDETNFGYDSFNGGDAALVLRRLTGWNSVWFTNDGTLLEFNPQSTNDYPSGMKQMIEFPEAYPGIENRPDQLKEFDGVRALLREVSQNFDNYILVAGSRQYIVPFHNPRELPEAHAFAITHIEATDDGIIIELVDPKDTTKAPHRLNELEFIKCFRKVSGVVAPISS